MWLAKKRDDRDNRMFAEDRHQLWAELVERKKRSTL